MKFTVAFILCISTTWAIKAKVDEPKDKREAAIGYGSSGHSNQAYNFQSPAQGHEDASSAISIGAGYSVGGGKPSYSFANQISGAAYQVPSQEGSPASGHGAFQLAPITLQSSHPGLVSNDLSQLMSQLSQGLNSGALTLSPGNQGVYQFGVQNAHGGQEIAVPQFAYSSPNSQQYTLGEAAQPVVPSYAAGTKGLGSYSSTGPVLFSPDQGNQAQNYASQSGGHSINEGASISYGEPAQSLSGYSLGNSGQSFGGSLNAYAGNYAAPGKSSFKPSAFLGSVQSEGGHSLSGSYAAPSFGNYHAGGLSLGAGGHGQGFGSLAGFSGGSPKYISQTYLPSKSADGVGSLGSIASTFSASGQLGHGAHSFPSSAYSPSNGHSALSQTPQYYVTSSKHSPGASFGAGSVSYKSPSSGHSSLNSYSSGPKYSFGGQSTRYLPPKDSHGAYSETNYNTIKYSEELKPRIH
ncbi:pro-resilin-like [Pieris napi]|uniref:pro-resilin-like n=1 Tax=Pieris napi TaxID=78633 RepID=UPI001FB86F34|nr:pro-resilin-like [Pieris napi]